MARAEKERNKEEAKPLAPSRPAYEIARMEREMDRMFDDFFRPSWSPFRWGRFWPGRRHAFAPPSVDIDLYEDKNEIVAKAELPGIAKEDIDVTISNHHLTLKGEKRKEEDLHEGEYHFSECSYGSFLRTVELPAEVQTDKAKASFKNGVLEIRVPKTEDAKKKAIAVNVE